VSEDTRAIDAAHDISAHAAARERKGRTRPGGRAGDRSGRQAWWKILLGGFGLYLTATLLLASSGTPELVPTVLVLGAFLPPVSVAAFLYERGALPASLLPILALAFLAGGAIGSVVAQLLEPRLPPTLGQSATLVVGFGEELAKLVAIVWLLGRREYGSMLDGIRFGAAAGTGFAAFESMGYALTILQLQGDVAVMGEVLLARGVLAPLVHGTWAAIAAGVLWRERRGARMRVSKPVLVAFFGVVILHGLWEWSVSAVPLGIAVPGLSLAWLGVSLTVPELWLPLPAVAIGLAGLWILARLLREARRERDSLGTGSAEHGSAQ
jgi:RsiW-degrading membrane proteinase PrsW (M82 family)